MKSCLRQTWLAVAWLCLISGKLVAQDELQPLAEAEATKVAPEPPPLLDEDIPPPRPVPDDELEPPQPRTVTPQDVPATPGQEGRAYDFGVSYVTTSQGIQVRGVVLGSRAAAAGVKPNDVIVGINGNAASEAGLSQGVETVEVLRGGVRQTLEVGAAPAATQQRRGAAYIPDNRDAYTVPRRSSANYSSPPPVSGPPRAYRYAPRYNLYASPYLYGPPPGTVIGIGPRRLRVYPGIGVAPYGPVYGYGGYRGYGGYARPGYPRSIGGRGIRISIGF